MSVSSSRQVVAASPQMVWGIAACSGLVCLLLASGAVLAVVLYRASHRKPPDEVA